MAEDVNDKGKPDRSHINVDDPDEILYWTERFFVTEIRLRDTVARVGASAVDVATEFGKPFPMG